MKIQRTGTNFVFAISLVSLVCVFLLGAGEREVGLTQSRNLTAQLISTFESTETVVKGGVIRTAPTQTFLETSTLGTIEVEKSDEGIPALLPGEQTTTTGDVFPKKQQPLNQCPFVHGVDKTILTFTENLLVAVSLLPGEYEVELASSHRTNTGVKNILHESWYLELLDGNKNTLLFTQPIRDIRDDELLAVERVEQSISLFEKAEQARVVFPKDVDFSLDFAPLCASLRFLGHLPTEDIVLSTEKAVFLETTPPIDPPVVLQDKSIEKNIKPFTLGQKNETSASLQEHNLMQTGVTVVHGRVGSHQNHNTALAHSQTEDGAETSAAYAYLPDSRGFSEVFTYSKVLREEITANFENDLLTELEQTSHMHRNALIKRVFTDMGAKNEALQSLDLSRKSMEEGHLGQIDVGDTTRAFQAFGFMKRDYLDDLTDSDGDGVTDYDEMYIYQTNPFNPHTSNSILSDGERIVLGLDPLKTDMKVVDVESPRFKGEVREEMFAINFIQFGSDVYEDDVGVQQNPIEIRGTAPPLSFVTLFVYSTPIIVTVRTDKNGFFEYILKETLENGPHEMYVASVNVAGKVLVKSQPVSFVKTAEAIEYLPVMISAQKKPIDDGMQTLVIFTLLLILLLGIGTVLFIGRYKPAKEIVNKESIHEGE